jgi:hypothetical protein
MKGYWIGRVDVSNPDGYQNYVKANAVPSPNTAPASWCAAAPIAWRKAKRAPATW